jgi:hypothetical protein
MNISTIILPTGHGKSTLDRKYNWIKDAGLMCQDPNELRRLRQHARSTGEWTDFDIYWCDHIKATLATSHADHPTLIMVPSASIARRLGYRILAAVILPEEVLLPVLHTRPKSGIENALANRREVLESGVNIVYAQTYDEVDTLVVGFVLGMLEPTE